MHCFHVVAISLHGTWPAASGASCSCRFPSEGNNVFCVCCMPCCNRAPASTADPRDAIEPLLLLLCYTMCSGVKDVVITLNGCVDPVDNKGMPFTAVTDGNGTAVFAPSNTNPNGFVRYCYGSATGYCSWTAVGAAGKVYDSVMKVGCLHFMVSSLCD